MGLLAVVASIVASCATEYSEPTSWHDVITLGLCGILVAGNCSIVSMARSSPRNLGRLRPQSLRHWGDWILGRLCHRFWTNKLTEKNSGPQGIAAKPRRTQRTRSGRTGWRFMSSASVSISNARSRWIWPGPQGSWSGPCGVARHIISRALQRSAGGSSDPRCAGVWRS
jgi:hypothetical protein